MITWAFQEISAGTNLVAEVKPTSPGAGETVTITLSSYGFNVDTSSISWYVNGAFASQGVGAKTFTFNLGTVGEQTKVVAYVQALGGQKASKTFIFDPSDIELFWSAQTSKPGFYRGKALPSPGADIKITAWPYIVNRTGQKIDLANLSYIWKKDGTVLTGLSGVGKNSIIITTGKNARQVKISVEAKSLADNITANRDLIINLISPEILFYEKKPLEGINYGKIFPREYSLFDEEVTVRAEPYFLPQNGSGFNSFWQVDRVKAQGQSGDPWTITLRPDKNVSGSNLINFTTGKGDLILSNSFIIKYGSGLFKTPQ